jgi:TctA family transporter
MAGAFASGLYQVCTPVTLGLMGVGIALGFAVGILPGLGGPTTLALMLPFIFTMQPVEAFAFLLGMAAVTATTGDITSILFGVPGEPTTASTIMDGHPMAKNGEAGRALGAALMSSLASARSSGRSRWRSPSPSCARWCSPSAPRNTSCSPCWASPSWRRSRAAACCAG